MEPPLLDKDVFTQLLEICTCDVPFRHPNGVAMGSPLGPTFAEFYMGHVERTVFGGLHEKPQLYARYVDDIFVMVTGLDELMSLKTAFEDNSVLHYTYELSDIHNQLPFLDVLVTQLESNLHLSIYTKPTSAGTTLNGDGFCPEQYKKSTILSYLSRAYNVAGDWSQFHIELQKIKSLLINNNFSNSLVDHTVKEFLTKKCCSTLETDTTNLVVPN